MSRKLTDKQRAFLEYLIAHLKDHEAWPRYREIIDHFGYRSHNSVTQNLRALQKKGFLKRTQDRYELVDQEGERTEEPGRAAKGMKMPDEAVGADMEGAGDAGRGMPYKAGQEMPVEVGQEMPADVGREMPGVAEEEPLLVEERARGCQDTDATAQDVTVDAEGGIRAGAEEGMPAEAEEEAPAREAVVMTVARHFVGKAAIVRAIYERLREAVSTLGAWTEDPKKTSIHFVRRTAFADIATRKEVLLLTVKADRPVASPRVVRCEPTSANRWHVEIRLTDPSDIDAELLGWLEEAYDLSGLTVRR